MNIIADKNYFNLYNLATTKLPATDDRYFDKSWYKECIQDPIREFLNESVIVETVNGKEKVNRVCFPDPKLSKEEREIIWQFSSDLGMNKLPIKVHMHEWSILLWGDCSKVDINDLVADLKGKENIATLTEALKKENSKVFDWYNDCIDFIYKIGGQDLFNDNKILLDQHGSFNLRKNLSIDEIGDEVLKEISLLVGFDFYEKLIHKDVFFKDGHNAINMQEVATKITTLILSDDRSSDRVKAITMLIKWFEQNTEKSKEFFSELFRKKEKLLVDTIEDKDSLFLILKSDVPFSTLASIVNQENVSAEALTASFGKAQELDDLLRSFDVDNVEELKELLDSNKGAVLISKTEITKEDLLSLGVTSLEELEEALKDKNLANQFFHKSTPTREMFSYAQGIIKRARENIIDHLKNLPDYDCTHIEELATTVLGGVKKRNLPIHIVIRPSDNKQVIVYYRSEKDTLDYENAELWIDDGMNNPRLLTLGKILKNTKITKIPV